MANETRSESGIVFVEKVAGVAGPIGHYSHLAELPNGMVYLSGQKAWDVQTGVLVDEDVAGQTDRVFDNIELILGSVDLDLGNVVRISCHLASVDDYEPFNEVFARRMGAHVPTRTTLAGYQLRDGALIEAVVDAYRPRKQT